MKKQTKPKSKRTQVKDLSVTQQELTTDEATKVKGGTGYFKIGDLAGDVYTDSTSRPSTTTTTILSPPKR